MRVEQSSIQLEELDELLETIYEPTAMNGNGDITEFGESPQDQVTSFLETFATSVQLEVFEMAKENAIVYGSKEATLWPRFQAGVLWHPAIISKLARLSGIGSLVDVGEAAWKERGDCEDDVRFASSGARRPPEVTRELMDICEGCPVLSECHEHVVNSSLQYGFWAGVARSKGTGYHEDGTPITLEEKRAAMDSKGRH